MKKVILNCFAAIFGLVAVNIFAGFEFVPSNSAEKKYCGAGSFTEESETITYATKETSSYSIKGDLPCYYWQTDSSNCANVAGSIIIGYYDRFCENLVPDFKTYLQIGTIFRYKAAGNEIQNVTETLYSLMGTDVGAAGTTFDGFHSGMKSYVNSCGYSYSKEDLGSLDFNKYKTAVESDKPVAVFVNNYSLADTWQDSGTSEVIKSYHNTVAHVVVGCGYKVDTYYDANGHVIATRTYLKVASGITQFGITYLCLDGKSIVDKATSIIIQ